MQLFISNQYNTQNNQIIIHDERILYQCSKVLRYTNGDRFRLQDQDTRHEIEIQSRDKKSLQGIIMASQNKP